MVIIPLKKIRWERGLTVQQLAKMSGVKCKDVENVEDGDKYPRIDVLFDIAKALGLTLNDLVKEVSA